MSDNRGRAVIVTGAGHGIGRAIAEAFAAHGDAVVAADVDLARAEATVQTIHDAVGAPAISVQVDVRDSASVDAMVEAALAKFGRIDVLVNNAGIYPSSLVVDMNEDEWDAVLDTNLKGTFLASRAVARRMIARGAGGRIINLTSGSAELGRVGAAHYCASKAAIKLFTQALALELAPHNIAVNAVGPGLIEVPGWSHSDEYIAAMTAANPMRRMGQPDEVARAVLYLADPATTYVTGTTLYVDGGGLAGRAVPISG
jgi:NAD(P)-dependent dehydrogenase (short-subunit alcohol dehydrogenase family)